MSDTPGAGGLTHFDAAGAPRMVDVTPKAETPRLARARARLRLKAETRRLIDQGRVEKGDVLGVARLAGIMATKRTHELIPLCHPLRITSVDVALTTADAERPDEALVLVEATVQAHDRTGVEMEALTAASVAALTVYDMVKAVDRWMTIEQVELVEKRGGKSGALTRG
ncbi:MAG: cyclic pyranopterin monophosphate synthase MoaC [Planctomycetes bacterium]|nr:cyclic pyranopterin monophosphate synthase MoaC [Planctomycetota bacterium]